MVALNYLLDSVILIDHFNGVAAATEFIRINREESAISAITRAEVLAGFPETANEMPMRLLDAFHCHPIDRDIADAAAALRHRHRWKLPDALQAAVAQHHALQLVTRNTKDFPPRKFAFVLAPYVL